VNVLDLFRPRRTTCRHPSVCDATPGPDRLMCDTHAADEPLTFNRNDRLEPWDLNRRSVWPTNRGRRNG
jgi:hypothetical protein